MPDTGLQGRLSDFTLEEILQLIGLQQKTGLLKVDASYPMALYFEAGILVCYRDRRRTGSDPLETFVKSYGFFSSESWEHIDYVQRHSQLDLAEILVNEGLLDADGLAAVQMEAAQECLVHGMLLRDGRYQFLSGRGELENIRGRVRMKVESLLMEAVRRIDEMPGLKERFASGSLKIRRTHEEIDEAELPPTQKRLLSIIGEETTLQDVVSQGQMSEFQTLETLEQLRKDGAISVQTLPRSEGKAKKRPQERESEREATSSAGQVGLLLLCLILGALLTLARPFQIYASRPTEGAARAAELQRTKLEYRGLVAHELFQRNHPRRNPNWSDLVAARYLSPEDGEVLQALPDSGTP